MRRIQLATTLKRKKEFHVRNIKPSKSRKRKVIECVWVHVCTCETQFTRRTPRRNTDAKGGAQWDSGWISNLYKLKKVSLHYLTSLSIVVLCYSSKQETSIPIKDSDMPSLWENGKYEVFTKIINISSIDGLSWVASRVVHMRKGSLSRPSPINLTISH